MRRTRKLRSRAKPSIARLVRADYTPALRFDDARNSQYIPLLFEDF